MTTEPVRVKWTLDIGFVGAKRTGEFTIDREEWNGLTPDEREKYLNDCYDEETVNYLCGGWDLVNADIDDPVKGED